MSKDCNMIVLTSFLSPERIRWFLFCSDCFLFLTTTDAANMYRVVIPVGHAYVTVKTMFTLRIESISMIGDLVEVQCSHFLQRVVHILVFNNGREYSAASKTSSFEHILKVYLHWGITWKVFLLFLELFNDKRSKVSDKIRRVSFLAGFVVELKVV